MRFLLVEVSDENVTVVQLSCTAYGSSAGTMIRPDLVMAKVDGIEAVQCILEKQSGACILVLTRFNTDDRVFPAIKAGALGALLESSGCEIVGEATNGREAIAAIERDQPDIVVLDVRPTRSIHRLPERHRMTQWIR